MHIKYDPRENDDRDPIDFDYSRRPHETDADEIAMQHLIFSFRIESFDTHLNGCPSVVFAIFIQKDVLSDCGIGQILNDRMHRERGPFDGGNRLGVVTKACQKS